MSVGCCCCAIATSSRLNERLCLYVCVYHRHDAVWECLCGYSIAVKRKRKKKKKCLECFRTCRSMVLCDTDNRSRR